MGVIYHCVCVCTSDILCVLSCRFVNNEKVADFTFHFYIIDYRGRSLCVCADAGMRERVAVCHRLRGFFTTKLLCSERFPALLQSWKLPFGFKQRRSLLTVLDGISFSAGSQEITGTPSASEGHCRATGQGVLFNSLCFLVVVLSDYRLNNLLLRSHVL